MNLSKKILLALLVCLSVLSLSCKKDDGGSPSPGGSGSRDVQYILQGTASGTISAIYIGATGSGESEGSITLPWSKNFTAAASVPSITLSTAVSNATPGQTITAKIVVGGQVKRENSSTIDGSGNASVALQPYIF